MSNKKVFSNNTHIGGFNATNHAYTPLERTWLKLYKTVKKAKKDPDPQKVRSIVKRFSRMYGIKTKTVYAKYDQYLETEKRKLLYNIKQIVKAAVITKRFYYAVFLVLVVVLLHPLYVCEGGI